MKVLVDTNVVLNVLLNQKEFLESSRKVLEISVDYDCLEFLSATSITDIHYILSSHLHSSELAKEAIKKLLSFMSIVGISALEIEKALELDWNDFEDSV